MKDYRQFLFEAKDYKVTWLKKEPVSSKVESKKLKELIETGTNELYNLIHITDKNIPTIDKESPILVYFGTDKDGVKLLDQQGIKQETVYNRTTEAAKSMRKDDWHNILGDAEWMPKTVTDVDKIDSLEFPIIAKPSEGHSGIGIMKFETMEDCQKELDRKDCNLDTFSEVIKDIDTEFRFVFVKDKLFLVHERIPIEEMNKTIDTKKPDESLGFLYVEQDLSKENYDISNIVKEFRNKINLDFYALDVMRDIKGKYWVIESNSGIGMGGNTMARSYEAICKDYYNTDIPVNKKKLVEQICKEYYDEIKKDYPKELKKSKNPKIYK
tara:strand:+ start:783 stop:1760 length:978 start_codon:yes stop_codon:yes gene_type:complete